MTVFVKDNEERPAQWHRFDPNDDVLGNENCEYRYGLRGHDLEEFTEVIERHGMWTQDRKDFGDAVVARQLPLKPVDQVAADHDRRNHDAADRLEAQLARA